MSKIKRLLQSYSSFIAVPWRDDVAAPQRVIFCVYDKNDERALRTKIDEFELATREAGHGWALFDLTDTFANWLAPQRYAENYFRQPDRLSTLLPQYQTFIAQNFAAFIEENAIGADTVVALAGVGTLYGFLKVRDVVDVLAPMVKGRLLLFFPGSYENNNYRLLDASVGWNYLAVPITADKDF